MPYRPNSQKPTNLPYTKHSSDSDAAADIGGPTIEFTAGGTLKLGECVCLTAADTVNKSAVAGTIVNYVGVVVGGAQLKGYVNTEKNKYGVLNAALVNERVIVQTRGVAYVITDAAYAVGVALVPSTAVAGSMITNAGVRGNAIMLEATGGAAGVGKAILL
jgi:hypothetical protein